MTGTKETPRLVTAESVRTGHPDKLCDQIADSILDAHLRQDKNARVAIEVMATDGKILIAGEVTSAAQVNYHRVVYEQLGKIGYRAEDLCEDPSKPPEIEIHVHEQSPDISQAVYSESADEVEGFSLADSIGAGDQGIMIGYATDETPEMMPLPVVLSHNICRKLDELMPSNAWMGADGKAQVTALYRGDHPAAVTDVVVSVQHTAGCDQNKIHDFIVSEVLEKVIPAELWTEQTKIHINPSGCFVKGGPAADTGLTGRKLAVDGYGPVAHIGAGAMSGKDPTKVDRSGAYAVRWVAKNIVCAGLAKRCEIQIAYAIGQKKPVSVSIDTFGTGKAPDDVLVRAVKRVFDLRPGALIETLLLRKVRYEPLAAYGHFGRMELDMPWEQNDEAEELKLAVNSGKVKRRRRMNRYA
ncbi:MAG: methionine adenosyltransferase [Clostridia bacterium]|nr:methionine adenosyltransferase [Clostridia bacterium]